MSDEPEKPESIWQPLDGSTPPTPAGPGAAGGGLSFTKPEPRPLSEIAVPRAPEEPGVHPQTGQAVFVLAQWWPRAGAYILDSLIFGVAVLLVMLPVWLAMGMTLEDLGRIYAPASFQTREAVPHETAAWIFVGVQVVLQGTLPAIFLVIWAGQTPGKRMLGLRVVRVDGSAMTLGLALRRELVWKTLILQLLATVTFGIAFLINYLWPLRDVQNRAGEDFFAKTRVVVAPRS